MRCEEARTAIVAREFGPLGPAWTAALDEHLRRCESCRVLAEGEAALTETLRRAAPAVPAVDVSVRIRERIRSSAPLDRRLVRGREIALAAAVAMSAALGLSVTWTVVGAEIVNGLRIAKTFGGGLGIAVLALWRPIGEVAAVLLRVGSVGIEALWTSGRALAGAVPGVQAAIALAGAAIALAVVVLVGRDVRRTSFPGKGDLK
jgi:predicted anti-sigma-YlaC factor YlaD